MTEVVVLGGGIAGLTAALKLAERGFSVSLVEQDDHFGGKLGAYYNPHSKQYFEHSYHMYLNWYHNFWSLCEELGIKDDFEPRRSIRFLRKGQFPRATQIKDVGSIETLWENVNSQVIPSSDMFIYAYSLIDLLSQEYDPDNFLDRISVNGFMSSRGYASNQAAEQHSRTLAKAFASYSYRTSAASYRKFIEFGARRPSPMIWVLKGNVHEHLIAHIENRLASLGCRFHKLTRVERLELDSHGRIGQIHATRMDRSPSEFPTAARRTGEVTIPVEGFVVCAVPPNATARLITDRVHHVAPELGQVAHLNSEPMASLDLYFHRRLEHIPEDHVVLMQSRHELTFFDNSQLWPDYDKTFLSLVASDTDHFSALSKDTAIKTLVDELQEYVPCLAEDIDFDRSQIRFNLHDQLFVNEVGSWRHRPETRCGITNLMMAGDYCRNFIDVVTVEGAVMSGLNAAQAIVEETGRGAPVSILRPEGVRPEQAQAIKLALAPYAYAAKAWSHWGEGFAQSALAMNQLSKERNSR